LFLRAIQITENQVKNASLNVEEHGVAKVIQKIFHETSTFGLKL
jgi:hypothetical protein